MFSAGDGGVAPEGADEAFRFLCGQGACARVFLGICSEGDDESVVGTNLDQAFVAQGVIGCRAPPSSMVFCEDVADREGGWQIPCHEHDEGPWDLILVQGPLQVLGQFVSNEIGVEVCSFRIEGEAGFPKEAGDGAVGGVELVLNCNRDGILFYLAEVVVKLMAAEGVFLSGDGEAAEGICDAPALEEGGFAAMSSTAVAPLIVEKAGVAEGAIREHHYPSGCPSASLVMNRLSELGAELGARGTLVSRFLIVFCFGHGVIQIEVQNVPPIQSGPSDEGVIPVGFYKGLEAAVVELVPPPVCNGIHLYIGGDQEIPADETVGEEVEGEEIKHQASDKLGAEVSGSHRSRDFTCRLWSGSRPFLPAAVRTVP